MSFFKKLANLLSPPGRDDLLLYGIVVQCDRCGEIIRARIHLYNDLSIEYGEREEETRYFCRKVLMGEGHCFQRVEVELTFDANRKLMDRQVRGGQFMDA